MVRRQGAGPRQKGPTARRRVSVHAPAKSAPDSTQADRLLAEPARTPARPARASTGRGLEQRRRIGACGRRRHPLGAGPARRAARAWAAPGRRRRRGRRRRARRARGARRRRSVSSPRPVAPPCSSHSGPTPASPRSPSSGEVGGPQGSGGRGSGEAPPPLGAARPRAGSIDRRARRLARGHAVMERHPLVAGERQRVTAASRGRSARPAGRRVTAGGNPGSRPGPLAQATEPAIRSGGGSAAPAVPGGERRSRGRLAGRAHELVARSSRVARAPARRARGAGVRAHGRPWSRQSTPGPSSPPTFQSERHDRAARRARCRPSCP